MAANVASIQRPASLKSREIEIGRDVFLDRVQSDLSVDACAEHLGISPAEYLASEAGTRSFSLEELRKLAELFADRIQWPTDSKT